MTLSDEMLVEMPCITSKEKEAVHQIAFFFCRDHRNAAFFTLESLSVCVTVELKPLHVEFNPWQHVHFKLLRLEGCLLHTIA